MKPLTIMSTCRLADEPRDEAITGVFRDAVESFFTTAPDSPLVVVDDGSTDAHRAAILELASRHPMLRYVLKSVNRGTARSKNTALRIFDESDADHAFLVDDDILFLRPGWQKAYLDAMRASGYHFLTFFEDRTRTMIEHATTVDMQPTPLTVGGARLKTSPFVMGVFWVLDREAVRRVGGFREFPRKYGHWHTEHNFRCLESGLSGSAFTDLADSDLYIRLNTQASVYTDEEKREMATENARVPIRGRVRWAPIVE